LTNETLTAEDAEDAGENNQTSESESRLMQEKSTSVRPVIMLAGIR